MRPAAFQDPLLPGPQDQALDCDRRLNGPKGVDAATQADYDEYCTLYAEYIKCRQPFWRKPEWIPEPQTNRLVGWERLLAEKLILVGGNSQDREYQTMLTRTPAKEREYRAHFEELVQAIEALSNCNYVHSSCGGARTRIVALYDYQTHGDQQDVVHDITDDRNWMFPTPGGPRVMEAQVSTRYFENAGENYVPEQGYITGSDQARVFSDQELPPKRQAHEVCLSISKHPTTATKYASILWAAVRGE